MFLTQKNQIRGLEKHEYEALREMCHTAKNLYNVGLYNIRQYFFQESKYLRYESNYHVSKDNENYKLLQAGVSQQILKVVDRSFRSFFNLLRKCKKGEYHYHDVKLPKYLPKEGLFPLILSTNAISIKNGFLLVPMSNEFKKVHTRLDKIRIPFPERLQGKTIKEVRIIPQFNGKFFTVEYVYEQEVEPIPFENDYILGIDFGLNNLATCVSSKDGASFIIDGKKIKSINHLWNKEKARLQSMADKQDISGTTERIARITINRNNQVKDVIRKTARHIIDYCIDSGIGKVIAGYNLDFKRNINIGKANNQNFVQVPLGKLCKQLSNLAERYGIEYVEQEESYTSKASFLDADEIPVFDPSNCLKHNFSGKRVKRGLYQSASGMKINADVNGAWNIVLKSKHRLDIQRVYMGILANPLRIRLS